MESVSTSIFTADVPANQMIHQLQSAANVRNVLFQAAADGKFMMRCKHLCQAHPRNTSSPLLHGQLINNANGTCTIHITFKPPKAVYLFLIAACAFFLLAGVCATFVLHKSQALPAAFVTAVALLIWYRCGGITLCRKEQEYLTDLVVETIKNPHSA